MVIEKKTFASESCNRVTHICWMNLCLKEGKKKTNDVNKVISWKQIFVSTIFERKYHAVKVKSLKQ